MPADRKTAPRAWQRMLSGRRLDLIDPSPLDIEIEDIAHGLARVARWNGQTTGRHAFSVAQHTLVVDAVADRTAPEIGATGRLALLLHDAPEYVIGDMISPFKALLGGEYKAVESRLLEAIHRRFSAFLYPCPIKYPQRSRPPTRSPPISRRRGSPVLATPRHCATSGVRAASTRQPCRWRPGRLPSPNNATSNALLSSPRQRKTGDRCKTVP